MARLVIADSFVSALAQVESANIRGRIISFVSYLEDMPEMGSPDVRPSIRQRFGDTARKLVVPPFVILYVYDVERDEVHVDGLVYQRRVK